MIADFVPVNNALFASTAKLSVYGEGRLMTEGSRTPFTRYSRLSNRLSNGFDNRLNVCIHDTTGCQTTGLTTG